MRQLAFLTILAGAFAAPALAQYPSANLTGSWIATSESPDGVSTEVRLDLVQNGAALAGREEIAGPNLRIALRIVGLVSANGGGIRQTAVERLQGMPNYDLQSADIEVTGPNSLTLHMRASAQYRGDEVLAFNRMGRNSAGYAPVQSPATTPARPQAPYINGPWTATVGTPAGPVTVHFNFTQSGDNFEGREVLMMPGSRGAAVSVSGRITGTHTATVQESVVEQLRGLRTYCLQSGELRDTGPNQMLLAWQPSGNCPAATMTLTRGTGNAQTAQRGQGVTPGDAFMMMLFKSLMGGDSTPSDNAGDEERQRQLDNARLACEGGSSYDCYRANMPTPKEDPPPSDPPNE
jgi:hypothetical protein